MSVYRTTQYRITEKDPAYAYLDRSCLLANNLYNATLFRIRQCLTGLKKEHPSANEQEVIDEITNALPGMNQVRQAANDRGAEKYRRAVEENLRRPPEERTEIKRPSYSPMFQMPTARRWFISYEFIEALMKTSGNPDYTAMPSMQLAQNIIKAARHDMDSIVKSWKAYAKDPSGYTGKPGIPGYHKKGGRTTITFSNQDCRIKNGELLFPNTKVSVRTGDRPGVLKQVTVKPWHHIFVVTMVMELPEAKPLSAEPRRVMSIDVGVENTAAITNNTGNPCLLFKGGTLKSINQKFNKDTARMVSEQTLATGKKFVPTPEYHAACLNREGRIHDLLHKDAGMIIGYALLWGIDTIVFGKNPFWKQNANIGHKNNQEFVQIPFAYFGQCLKSLCEETGIRYLEQEESYTSKASFLDNDFIPTYGVDDQDARFSGKRAPVRYRGMHKKDGFRGLYRAKDGTVINSDLNGSANIGRKCFPDMYTWEGARKPDFNRVVIITHPELWDQARNRNAQQESGSPVSRSKQKRQAVKARRIRKAQKPAGLRTA